MSLHFNSDSDSGFIKRMHMNETIDYYEKNANDFVSSTQRIYFHEIQDYFLSFIPKDKPKVRVPYLILTIVFVVAVIFAIVHG